MKPSLSPAVQALWERWRRVADPEARAELLRQHTGLVHHTARQIAERVGDAVGFDDLVGAGMLGLVRAFEGFDASRGVAFTTYATQRVRGAILDELRAADWRPRSVRQRQRQIRDAEALLTERLGRRPTPDEVATALQIDLETYWAWSQQGEGLATVALDAPIVERGTVTRADLLSDPDAPLPDEGLHRADRRTVVVAALAQLPEQQRTVLALCYYEGLTLRQIAEVLHVTESRISQVRTAALRTLRECVAVALED